MASKEKQKYSRFIVIRFMTEYEYEEGLGFYRKYKDKTIKDGFINSLILEFPPQKVERLISNVNVETIKRIESIAQLSAFPPIRSLTTYWRLDYRNSSEEELKELANQFDGRGLSEIETVYSEFLAQDATANPIESNPYIGEQIYLNPSPIGINAKYAWDKNIRGQNVGFIDLEQGWILCPKHEDLPMDKIKLLEVNGVAENRDRIGSYIGIHGINTLGVVLATNNDKGTIGIASDTEYTKLISYDRSRSDRGQNIAESIVEVIVRLINGEINIGDILLLEVQLEENAIKWPAEIATANFDAIRLATALGLIVIEAAGNSKVNLDLWKPNNNNEYPLSISSEGFRDSGAIMVGAAKWRNGKYVNSANYGTRINCFAHGENVATSGGNENWRADIEYSMEEMSHILLNDKGDLSTDDRPDTSSDNYTSNFGGTSAASAIIAGAAILLQSAYKNKCGHGSNTALSPLQMRHLLSTRGVEIAFLDSRGNEYSMDKRMPDLNQIIDESLFSMPDLYIRNTLDDVGIVPFNDSIENSPDIIVLSSAISLEELNEKEKTWNLEIVPGSLIYLRISNKGGNIVNERATIEIYLKEVNAQPSFGSWNLITSIPIYEISQSNEFYIVDSIVWDLPPQGDYHIVVVIRQMNTEDILSPLRTDAASNESNFDELLQSEQAFEQFIRNNNNVACRRFKVA